MSSRPPPLSPEDREWMAAELALGLLDGADLIQARRLQAEDLAFSREVARWSARFAPLLDGVEEITPPAGLFDKIERRLGMNVVDLQPRLRRWQWGTGAMTALAASLAVALLLQPNLNRPPAPVPAAPVPATMVAVLKGDSAQFLADWNGRARLVVVASQAAAPASRSHELWVIPEDGKPRSMGLIEPGTRKLEVGPAMAALLNQGATLAVSLEPAGGSPTGSPTGAVIASGPLTAV